MTSSSKTSFQSFWSWSFEAWAALPVLADDAKEDDVTDKLYAAMRRSKNRQRHPFRIHPQASEFHLESEKIIGWKDIAFYPPSNDEEIYFCLEAKRLNAVISGTRTSGIRD